MADTLETSTRISSARSWYSTAQDALLVVVSALFLYAHAAQAFKGHWTSIGFALEQGLLVGMFLTRRRSVTTSRRPLDWIVATASWMPLLMRPADSPTQLAGIIGSAIQMMGLLGTCVCFVYLGRSFGIVAANRGLKVDGPYRIVRHPIYFTHTVTATGFVLANFTVTNVAILVVLTTCQLLRLRAEERILTETGGYAEYADRVRWRLVPGLY